MNIVIQAIINGLLSGGVYALVAVGITIIFGVMKMVNFAMGEFIMLGMYMTWIGYEITKLENYFQIPFVIVTMTILAIVCFYLVIRPVIGKGGTLFILVTVGLSKVLQSLALMIFGPNYKTVPSSIKESSINIGRFVISLPRLMALLAGIVFVIILYIILNKSILGRAMRATSEKPDVAEILGINTRKTYLIAFIIGVILAGLAGLLVTPIYYVNPTVGVIFKVTGLIVVVLGGLGSIQGALVGGFLAGVIESIIAVTVSPELGPAGIFVMLLIVLSIKPTGLFGKKLRVG